MSQSTIVESCDACDCQAWTGRRHVDWTTVSRQAYRLTGDFLRISNPLVVLYFTYTTVPSRVMKVGTTSMNRKRNHENRKRSEFRGT